MHDSHNTIYVKQMSQGPATWVRFPAGTGKIFSLYDNGAHRK